jgi:hypothetical protein
MVVILVNGSISGRDFSFFESRNWSFRENYANYLQLILQDVRNFSLLNSVEFLIEPTAAV